MAQGNPFGGMGPQTNGLTPPDFSIHNQFANAPRPMTTMGGGSPFALSAGAAAAASSLPNFNSGQFGASSGAPQLGGGMSSGAIGQAAQKLMQAADKLIQAADRLMGGRGGGGTGTGGPSFGGLGGGGLGGGQPFLGGQGFIAGGMSYGAGGPSFNFSAGRVGGLGLTAVGAGLSLTGAVGGSVGFAASRFGVDQTTLQNYGAAATNLQNLQSQTQYVVQSGGDVAAHRAQIDAAQHQINTLNVINPNLQGANARVQQLQYVGGLARAGAGAAFSVGQTGVGAYFAAGQAQIATQQTYQQMGGLGNTFRQIAAQNAQAQGQFAGSLGGAAAGALIGFFLGGPMGAMVGASITAPVAGSIAGQSQAQYAANDPAALARDELVQYQTFKENLNMANTSADVFSAAGANTKTSTDTERLLRDKRFKLAASVSEYNRMSGGVAAINKSSLALSALRGDATLNARIGLGGEFGNYRSALGMTTSEVIASQTTAIAASGHRGVISDDLLIGGMQGGYSAGQIGVASSANRSGATRGLGLSGTGLLEEANARGLVGDSATKYIQAQLGFYGSYAESGVNISKGFVERTNQFINAGRSMGLRSFGGRRGFARAEEVRTLGERGANKISEMFAGLGSDLLFMQSLMDNNGDLQATYGDLKSLSGARAQDMLKRVTGGNEFIMGLGLMGERMSPDVIKAMQGADMTGRQGTLARKGLGVQATAAGETVAETLADRESNLLKSFSEASFKQISKLDEQIAEQKLSNVYLKAIAQSFKDAKDAVKEPQKAYAPAGKSKTKSPAAASPPNPKNPSTAQRRSNPKYGASDIRLKQNIKQVGVSKLGLNIYEFSYIWDATKKYIGVMAQELLGTKFEQSAIMTEEGYYMVDYSNLDVEFKEI